VVKSLDEQNAIIVDHLRQAVEGLIAVYRFGSTARGEAIASSDTDVAVLAAARLQAEFRFDLQEALAAKVGHVGNLLSNQTRQDAIVLNLQRARESSIDAAMHIVRLGCPVADRVVQAT
jgi:predicted nucleotidyltransferase